MSTSPIIFCQNIVVKSSCKTTLLENVSLAVHPGERVAIAGPSGSGKTTLLRSIAGLQPIDAGVISIDGEVASQSGGPQLPPHRRRIGMILQDLGLWPSLTVLEHLTHSPRAEGTSKAAHLALAKSLLDHLGLSDFAKRTPGNLSGGEQQRVAIGAVLMGSPRALLLDEPFGSLDLALKIELIDLLDKWARQLDCAMILVSHTVSEAGRLGVQRLLILESGRMISELSWDDLVLGEIGKPSPTLTAWRAEATMRF